jgi:hypothetical protein
VSHQYLDDDPTGTASDTFNVNVQLRDDDTGSDTSSTSVTILNVAPDLGAINVDQTLVPINAAINASASFSDVGTQDTHSAVWSWGDGTTAGTVSEAGGSGSVDDSHAYSTPGVYTIELTITDDDTGSDSSTFQEYVVVYDASGGFVTGGGWILSPEGACPGCETSPEGKATFGFVSKYKKGADTPTGQTEFQFKTGDLNFHSSSYDWLVIAGANAKYKGMGAINGEGEYKFMLTATDGDLLGGGKADEFRIRIWDDVGLYYDNKKDLGDEEYGGTELGGGNIVIHKAKNK